MINFWFSKDYMTGGNIYNRMVFDVLKNRGFDIVEKKAYTPYHGKGFTYLNALYAYLGSATSAYSRSVELDIMDYSAASWCSRRHRAKRVIIMFHFDLEETKKKKKHQFFFNRFLKNAQNAQIVVISQYWKNYLSSLGLNNIEVIYCAYDVPRYKQYISKQHFLQKFGLPDKPIIYLGKNSKPKTLNAYKIVKSLENDYLIITTGPKKEFNGPVHLDLDFNAYSSLLHFCTVTLLLPKFSEGWSRIAHESLICGTPVIGNGRGGMRELLEKTNQIISDENQPAEIHRLIKKITASAERVRQKDSLYVRQFDLKYFGQHWETLIENLLPGESRENQ
jgi:glycosyltransferase involved in cell wall biosynthesis